MFDRFQIVLGHYVFCMFWHGGQTCPLYARMCKISRYYNPGMRGESLHNPENWLALKVYRNLCDKHNVKCDM